MMPLFCVLAFCLFFWCGTPAFAEQYNYAEITNLDGKPLFTIKIANEGEQVSYTGESLQSDFTLNNAEVNALINGLGYWGAVLNKYDSLNTVPEVVLVTGKAMDDGAFAISDDSFYDTGLTELADTIQAKGEYLNAVALIKIDKAKYFDGTWYTDDMASLPSNGEKSCLPSTMLHELGHALGLSASAEDVPQSQNPEFESTLSLWTKGLRNKQGKAPRTGQEVVSFLPNSLSAASSSQEGVYFTGEQVKKVLNGAMLGYADNINNLTMPGIPVNGWELKRSSGQFHPDLSHMELQNSTMSHQNYRNWNVYMEAELAMMQDIGYDIDRRNFFGYSVYNSEHTFINTNPFFARNALNSDFKKDEYNTTPWGVGLHIYGSQNIITQVADILSSGKWGIGIRVDGSENTLNINPNVRVHANGIDGNALAVTYGKGHTIIHEGEFEANGNGGIAARFDFGSNNLGLKSENRGSWLNTTWVDDKDKYEQKHSAPTQLPIALQGALIDSFEVTGSLKGSTAAIYIADNAHVKTINIMKGAKISGDIISEWDSSSSNLTYSNDKGKYLLTKLTFGFKADSAKKVTKEADSDFFLEYTGNIYGNKSIYMHIADGKLVLKGKVSLHSLVSDGFTIINSGEEDDIIRTGHITANDTVQINGEGGNDTITIDSITANASVEINGGEGNDTIKLENGFIQNGDSIITLTGGNGNDSFIIEGNNSTGTIIFTDFTGTNINEDNADKLSLLNVLDITKYIYDSKTNNGLLTLFARTSIASETFVLQFVGIKGFSTADEAYNSIGKQITIHLGKPLF